MKFFSRGCELRQMAYLAVAERLSARERVALEAHAVSCAECADALRNGRPMEIALRGAFAPLRERGTIIAPGRVRLAVGPRSARPNLWLRAPRIFGRLAEVSVMVGVTLFAVGSSLEMSTRPPALPAVERSVVQDYFRAQPPTDELNYFRWLRLVKSDVSPTIPDATHLPAGGRFDVDPVEIVKEHTSPR
jgi:anti-sigma factor RsiW